MRPIDVIAAEDRAISRHLGLVSGGSSPLLPIADLSAWGSQAAPERRWIVKDLVPYRQMTLLTGEGAAGKSLLVQQLCTCIASGRPFLGIEVEKQPTLYVTCEDDGDELWRRQEAICRQLGIDITSLIGELDLVSLAGEHDTALLHYEPSSPGDDFNGTAGEPGGMRPTRRFRALVEAARDRKYGLIGLDNTAQLFSGNENARHDVATFAGLLTRLAIATDGAVMLVGHPNKAHTGAGNGGSEYSGSTAWNNQVRSRLFLNRPDEYDFDARSLKSSKANYSAANQSLDFRWRDWSFVAESDLPQDAHAALRETAMGAADNAIFMKCLDEMTRQKRAVSDKIASRTFAAKIFAKMPEAKGTTEKRLAMAFDALWRSGEIERGELAWRSSDRKVVEGVRRKCG